MENSNINLISFFKFKSLFNSLKDVRSGINIRVVNVITKEVKIYISMKSVSRDLGIDIKSIKRKLNLYKLYKKTFIFKTL
jgi:hypothetical protein